MLTAFTSSNLVFTWKEMGWSDSVAEKLWQITTQRQGKRNGSIFCWTKQHRSVFYWTGIYLIEICLTNCIRRRRNPIRAGCRATESHSSCRCRSRRRAQAQIGTASYAHPCCRMCPWSIYHLVQQTIAEKRCRLVSGNERRAAPVWHPGVNIFKLTLLWYYEEDEWSRGSNKETGK